MRWVTSRLQARSHWKPDTPSPLAWKQPVDAMRRLLSAAAPRDGSSQNQERWALSRVAWNTGCVILGRRCTVDFSWREHSQSYRRIATGSNVHDDERERWLRILPWLHAVVTRGSHSWTRVWTWQTLSARWTGRRRRKRSNRDSVTSTNSSSSQGDGGFLRECWSQMALQAALCRWGCSWATNTRQTSLGLSSRERSALGRRRSQREMAHTRKGSALAGSRR